MPCILILAHFCETSKWYYHGALYTYKYAEWRVEYLAQLIKKVMHNEKKKRNT